MIRGIVLVAAMLTIASAEQKPKSHGIIKVLDESNRTKSIISIPPAKEEPKRQAKPTHKIIELEHYRTKSRKVWMIDRGEKPGQNQQFIIHRGKERFSYYGPREQLGVYLRNIEK